MAAAGLEVAFGAAFSGAPQRVNDEGADDDENDDEGDVGGLRDGTRQLVITVGIQPIVRFGFEFVVFVTRLNRRGHCFWLD